MVQKYKEKYADIALSVYKQLFNDQGKLELGELCLNDDLDVFMVNETEEYLCLHSKLDIINNTVSDFDSKVKNVSDSANKILKELEKQEQSSDQKIDTTEGKGPPEKIPFTDGKDHPYGYDLFKNETEPEKQKPLTEKYLDETILKLLRKLTNGDETKEEKKEEPPKEPEKLKIAY